MEILKIITIDEHEKWDRKVKSFESYDVGYLSGYAKAFQLHGDGEPLLFYYNDGGTRAINVAMKRDIAQAESFKGRLPLDTWFDLSTPYGYGGFLVEGENYEAVSSSYNEYCCEQGFVSEFVRFNLFTNCAKHFSGTYEDHTHNIVRSLELPLDKMLMDFEHKVRKNIKKANSFGLKIEIDTSGARMSDFLNIYYGTMKRTSAKEDFFFKKEFFETLNEMKDNCVYFHVLHEDKVISTELVVYANENCYSFLGGTLQDFFNLRPNDFLKYEIIKWAKEAGLKRFILGGGYGVDDGIYNYKKSFAPNGVYDYFVGKKIFDEVKYQQLLDLRKALGATTHDDGFFPAYRAPIEEAEGAAKTQVEKT